MSAFECELSALLRCLSDEQLQAFAEFVRLLVDMNRSAARSGNSMENV